ncbi:hypothetical protein B0H10DRAFT_1025983 [Mycena sp. CBHHK59/15]|nr:hypothetical protein B0H10DRAFT_1025983 [Mycena sp. CBHHK59/15]
MTSDLSHNLSVQLVGYIAENVDEQLRTGDHSWDYFYKVVDQHTPPLPTGASPPVPSPQSRSPSPYTAIPANKNPSQQTLRKKTPPALGILHALDPVQQQQLAQQQQGHVRTRSEERPSENGHVPRDRDERKEKKGFWGRGAERDKDREKDRDRAAELERGARERERGRDHERERRDEENELTRKIGFLTATSSEDRTLVLDVCDHASTTESNAKEARPTTTPSTFPCRSPSPDTTTAPSSHPPTHEPPPPSSSARRRFSSLIDRTSKSIRRSDKGKEKQTEGNSKAHVQASIARSRPARRRPIPVWL